VKIVLDPNVLVSGLISPYTKSADILRLVISGPVRLCVDARILAEYRELLDCPKFQFDPGRIDILLDYLHRISIPVISALLRNSLPDPGDIPFLEVAVSGGARYLITGNVRHFPLQDELVQIVTPAAFLEDYRNT